jgi:hypothetical protein
MAEYCSAVRAVHAGLLNGRQLQDTIEFETTCRAANGFEQPTFNVRGMRNAKFNVCYDVYGPYIDYESYYEDQPSTRHDIVFNKDIFVPPGAPASTKPKSVWAFLDSTDSYDFTPECLVSSMHYALHTTDIL